VCRDQEVRAAAERFNNFQHAIKKIVTTTNFMTDEGNKFYRIAH
jgi:hypothetical protein